MPKSESSTLAIVGALVAFGCLAVAGVLLLAPGPDSQTRLAAIVGIAGVAIPGLLALLRSDQTASNTNGSLDQRIEDGVHRALAGRRATDVPPARSTREVAPVTLAVLRDEDPD